MAVIMSLDALGRSKITYGPWTRWSEALRVFGDNATIYAAYILATLEWRQMYHHYGGRDAVPILLEWLTTRDLTTSADLPRQRVHVGHHDVWLNSAATW